MVFCSYVYESIMDFGTRRDLWIMKVSLLSLTTEVMQWMTTEYGVQMKWVELQLNLKCH